MTDADLDALGPVDYLVIEFPAEKANFTGEIAAELVALSESGTIRVLDLVLIQKAEDGSVVVDELSEVPDDVVGDIARLEADLALLLAEDDVAAIAELIEPGSVAGVLVFENRWAAPFGAAVRRA
ncbi:MAG: DUF6325 family protein, partial [Solirubrobacteraceae bacterium]|nr:DUF6325 family protein [Solirubrobacteraceae bacterium]